MKLGRSGPQLCYFFKCLAILGPLHFHKKFSITLLVSTEIPAEILTGTVLSYRSVWGKLTS